MRGLLVVVVGLTVALPVLNAIQCYDFDSGNLNAKPAEKDVIDCGDRAKYCLKYRADTKILGKKIVGLDYRCDFAGECEKNKCLKSDGIIECCCNKDKCNGSSGLAPLTVGSMILAAAAYLRR